MNKNDIYQLHTTYFDKIHREKNLYTMDSILDDALNQAIDYANDLKIKEPNSIFFVHVVLSVGTSWLIHKTKKLEEW